MHVSASLWSDGCSVTLTGVCCALGCSRVCRRVLMCACAQALTQETMQQSCVRQGTAPLPLSGNSMEWLAFSSSTRSLWWSWTLWPQPTSTHMRFCAFPTSACELPVTKKVVAAQHL